MIVRFKKLMDGAIEPKRGSKMAAGYDIYIPKDVMIECGRQVVPIGIAVELAANTYAAIDPRSGFECKGMEGYFIDSNIDYVSNVASRFDCDVLRGVIDADYRDGICVILNNRSGERFLVKAGMRIAQMIVHKFESVDFIEVEELSETERDGGFGNTGTM